MATGGSAYLKLEKPDNSISQSLQYWGGLKAKEDAAQKLEDERYAVRKAIQDKDAFEALELAPEDFETQVTGFDSRDDAMRDYAQYNTREFLDWGKRARQSRMTGDDKGYRAALNMQQKLKANFNNVKNGEVALKEVRDSFFTLENEGKISPVDEEYVKTMQALYNNDVRIVNDERGIPYFEALLKTDDPDAPNKWNRVRMSDYVNGNYRPYEVFELEGEKGWVNSLASNLGLERILKPDGSFYTLDTSKWNERNEAALSSAINGLISGGRTMSSILYQATGIKKKTGFTQEDKDTVDLYLYQRVRGNVSEEELRKWDAGRANYSLGQQRLRFDKEKEAKTSEVYDADLVTTVGGKVSSKTFPIPSTVSKDAFADSEEFTMRNKSGTPLKGIISDNANAEILSVVRIGGSYWGKLRTSSVITKKDDGASFLAKKQTSEKAGKTEYKIQQLNDTELARLAKSFGLQNANQLDGYFTQRARASSVNAGKKGGAGQFNKK